MPNYHTPGVYIEEVPSGTRPIEAVGTDVAAFIGITPDPTVEANEPVAINNWSHFLRECARKEGAASTPVSHAVLGFFQNGGSRCYVVNPGKEGGIDKALDALARIEEVKMVAAPGMTDAGTYGALLDHCENLKFRFAILDGPPLVKNVEALTKVAVPTAAPRRARGAHGGEPAAGETASPEPAAYRPRMSKSGHAAVYYPWILVQDPFNPKADPVPVGPSGHLAGIYARTDALRGVHKAPANEPVRGALDVTVQLTDSEQAVLNPAGVNCIRFFAYEGIRVWGARTVAESASEWRYLNVRRLFNMVEESIARSTRWVVFEPNDESLWKAITRDVRAFLMLLWRQGALLGRTPEEAFFVMCNRESNPPDVIDAGQVVTVVGLAPVKPAEFVIFKIGQSAGGPKVEGEGEGE